jgi:hypothetical protein
MTSGSNRPPGSDGPGPRSALLGTGLAIAGAALLLISFTAVTWLSGLGPAHFGDIRELLDTNREHVAAVPKAYFTWLAWVLLVGSVLAALLANSPRRTGNALPIIGSLIADVGIVLTFLAIKFTADGDYGAYLEHAAVGFYLAIGGFLLAAAGALVGLRRS